LAWLCGGYLIAALGISGLKYTVNIKSSGLGESMIRSRCEEIFSSSRSSFGPDENRGESAKDKTGTVVTMISAEAEAVGEFVGDCISTPIIQVGTLLSVLSYMLYTEPLLGLVVLGIAVPQVVIDPLVQRRINVQVRERARTLRHAGDLIVEDLRDTRESVGSLQSEIGKSFATIHGVRLHVFRLKFGLKLLVSALQSLVDEI